MLLILLQSWQAVLRILFDKQHSTVPHWKHTELSCLIDGEIRAFGCQCFFRRYFAFCLAYLYFKGNHSHIRSRKMASKLSLSSGSGKFSCFELNKNPVLHLKLHPFWRIWRVFCVKKKTSKRNGCDSSLGSILSCTVAPCGLCELFIINNKVIIKEVG